MGWWRFGTDVAAVAGVPADLWIGWALLWGTVPMLATTDRRLLAGAALGLVAFDLVVMPRYEPVLVLGDAWLVGEAVVVAVGLVPGLALGCWTARGELLAVRTLLQVIGATGLLAFVVPSLVFAAAGGGWAPLLDRSRAELVVAGLVLAPIAAPGVQAVREFVAHGGTPVPLDPPDRLVTTGPYAYVANPMQVAAAVLLVGWGLLLASPGVVAAAVASVTFSAGVAAWSEDRQLVGRFGDDWRHYRRQVRSWWPRWRPHVTEPAVVYVARSCEPCRQVADFLGGRSAVGLDQAPAELCAPGIRRITYRCGGASAVGLAAIGRSLEHVHLAWATVSWTGRLPGLQQILQLITDAVGGGPRPVGRPGPGAARAPGSGSNVPRAQMTFLVTPLV